MTNRSHRRGAPGYHAHGPGRLGFVAVLVAVLIAVDHTSAGAGGGIHKKYEHAWEQCTHGDPAKMPSKLGDESLVLRSYNVASLENMDAPKLSGLIELIQQSHVIQLVEVGGCTMLVRLMRALEAATGPNIVGCTGRCYSAYAGANDIAIVTAVQFAHAPFTPFGGAYAGRAEDVTVYNYNYVAAPALRKDRRPGPTKNMRLLPAPMTMADGHAATAFWGEGKAPGQNGAYFAQTPRDVECQWAGMTDSEVDAVVVFTHENPQDRFSRRGVGGRYQRVWVGVIQSVDGGSLRLIGTHLKAGRPPGAAAGRKAELPVCVRNAQVRILRGIINDSKVPFVLMGDLNDGVEEYGPYPTPRTNALDIFKHGPRSCTFGWKFPPPGKAPAAEYYRSLVSWSSMKGKGLLGHHGSLIDHICVSDRLVAASSTLPGGAPAPFPNPTFYTKIETVTGPARFSDHHPITVVIPRYAIDVVASTPWPAEVIAAYEEEERELAEIRESIEEQLSAAGDDDDEEPDVDHGRVVSSDHGAGADEDGEDAEEGDDEDAALDAGAGPTVPTEAAPVPTAAPPVLAGWKKAPAVHESYGAGRPAAGLVSPDLADPGLFPSLGGAATDSGPKRGGGAGGRRGNRRRLE